MNLSWPAPAASPRAAAPASPGTKWTGSPAAWVSTARDGTARHGGSLPAASCPPSCPSVGGAHLRFGGDPGVPGLGTMRGWPRWEGGRKARRRRREGMPARNLVSFKPSVARAPAALASFVLCFPGVSCLPCSRQFPWVLPPSGGGSGSRDPRPGGNLLLAGGVRSWTPASGSASGSSAESRNVRPKHPQETDRLPPRRLPRGCMRQIAAGCFKENIWAARFPSLSEDGAHTARSGPD